MQRKGKSRVFRSLYCHYFSLAGKVFILLLIVVSEYNISAKRKNVHEIVKATLNNILENKSCYIEDVINIKRNRQGVLTFENVAKTPFALIKYVRSQNVPISWIILKEKSLETDIKLEKLNFTTSYV